MKVNRIFSAWMLMASLSLGITSCVSDDSTEGGGAIPQLTVKGEGLSEMLTYNIYLGDECVIAPEITYKGGEESNLTYSWKIGTYANGVMGALEEVSTERNLNYKFETGGSYYAHLTVTDGKVGKAVDYRINVNRTFEEGYLITSTDANGKGNLAFVKILTPEEIAAGKTSVVIEHSLEKMNEGYSEDGLVSAVLGTVTWPKTVRRVLVSTDKHCYVIDPNNFTIITDIKYEDLYPGFKATHFMPDSYTPWAFDSSTKQFVHINLTYMFPYEYQYFKGCNADGFLPCKYTSWGSESLFTFYMNYAENKVAFFSAYAPYFGLDTYFPDTSDLLDGHTLLTAFYGTAPGSNYVTPSYILSRENETGDLTLWNNSVDSYYYINSNFTRQEFTPTATTAVPAQGAKVVPSAKQLRYYYPVDNAVYILLTSTDFALPDKSQYAIQFAANEEITFLDTNLSTDELYVATYDKTTQRGNFYIYDCKDVRTDNAAAVKAKAEYKNCAGRISSVMYKPSIQ